jgi:cytochrome c553
MKALRDGVRQDGRPVLLMPSQEYAVLSEQDLAAIIAYCRQLPPVDNQLPQTSLGPVAKVMAFAGKLPLLPVEVIDHQAPLVRMADTTEGIAQGKYLAISCSSCHRPNMKGGESMVPGKPPVPDITSSGNPGRWTQGQFLKALRTGNTPSGHTLNNEDMPWKMTAHYSDGELASLYQYLRSLK